MRLTRANVTRFLANFNTGGGRRAVEAGSAVWTDGRQDCVDGIFPHMRVTVVRIFGVFCMMQFGISRR